MQPSGRLDPEGVPPPRRHCRREPQQQRRRRQRRRRGSTGTTGRGQRAARGLAGDSTPAGSNDPRQWQQRLHLPNVSSRSSGSRRWPRRARGAGRERPRRQCYCGKRRNLAQPSVLVRRQGRAPACQPSAGSIAAPSTALAAAESRCAGRLRCRRFRLAGAVGAGGRASTRGRACG